MQPHSTKTITGVLVLLVALMVSGCWRQEIYLQDLNVTQGVAAPPVHLTQDSMAQTVRVSPRVTLYGSRPATGRIDGHSLVNSQGVFEVDSTNRPFTEVRGANTNAFAGKNLTWNFPEAIVGVDVDVAFTDRFAMNGSIEFGLGVGNRVLNGHVGLALLIPGPKVAGRIEGGVLFTRQPITADYLVTYEAAFSSTTEAWFQTVSGSQSSIDPYVSVTINSNMRQKVFGWFVGLGFAGQTMVSLEPSRFDSFAPGEYTGTLSVFSLTPGIIVQPADDVSVMGGIRLLWPGIFHDVNDPAAIIAPMVQVEITM
jgi:hypothetical protein